MIVFGYCTKCGNKGHTVVTTDEPISRAEESDAMAGLRMVEGGAWFKTKKVVCPDLFKSGHKR